MESKDIKYEQFIGKIRNIHPSPDHPELLTKQIINKIESLPVRRKHNKKVVIIKFLSGIAAMLLTGFFLTETVNPPKNNADTVEQIVSIQHTTKNGTIFYHALSQTLPTGSQVSTPAFLSDKDKINLISSVLKQKEDKRHKQQKMYTALINSINKENLQ